MREREARRQRSGFSDSTDEEEAAELDPDRFLSRSPLDMDETIRPWEYDNELDTNEDFIL